MPNADVTIVLSRPEDLLSDQLSLPRLILDHAGVKTKITTHGTESMPRILHDGVQLPNRSNVAARYLAQLTGLAGGSNLEQAKVDMLVEHIKDFDARLSRACLEPEGAAKILSCCLPNFLRTTANILKQQPYLVGDSLTYADLCVGEAMSRLLSEGGPISEVDPQGQRREVLEWFPELLRHSEMVLKEVEKNREPAHAVNGNGTNGFSNGVTNGGFTIRRSEIILKENWEVSRNLVTVITLHSSPRLPRRRIKL